MKFLVVGDIVGKCGRKVLIKALDQARELYNPDVVIVNGENAAGGFGITKKIYNFFINDLKIDCITSGNHWSEKQEFVDFLPQASKFLVPANIFNISDFKLGFRIFEKNNISYAIINLIGRAFISEQNKDPFLMINYILEYIPMEVKIKILDFHAEATSEKQAMGFWCAGKLSLVYGTHIHVQTADERIVNGTGFITDIGMCGAYDSIIGMRKDLVLRRFLTGQKVRLSPGEDEPWFCGLICNINNDTGICEQIERICWRY